MADNAIFKNREQNIEYSFGCVARNANNISSATDNTYNSYINNWPLQPFSQNYGLASDTTHVVCVNFFLYVSGGTYSLTSTPNERFLRNVSWQILFTLRVFARNRRRNIFLYFIFDDRPGIRTQAFASNKPTHYILHHGDNIF